MRLPLMALSALGCSLALTATALAQQKTTDRGVDRFAMESSNGDRLRLRGLAQFQLTSGQDDFGAGRELAPQLLFRRLRTGAEATLFDERVEAELIWSFVPGAAELIEAHVTVQLIDELAIQAGQFKTPYTRYRMNSGTDLVFVDWSIQTRYFGGERQVGAALRDGDPQNEGVHYALGVFTGQNARRSHGVGYALLYDEPRESPALLDADRRVPYDTFARPEFVGHIGWSSEGMDATHMDDVARTPQVRLHLGASAAFDLTTNPRVEAEQRAALEALVKTRGFALYGGLYGAKAESFALNPDAHLSGPALYGLLVSGSYRLSAPISLGARATFIDFADGLTQDLELLSESGADVTPERWFSEYAVGGRWDIYGPTLQFAADAGLEMRQSTSLRRGWMARTQLQLKF